MRTRLCDVLGIDVPIVQAPVTSDPALPLAVAAAGALGMVQASWTDDVAGTVGAVKDARVGVNFVLEWQMEERLEQALAAGAHTVSFFWGDAASLTERAKAAGATVLVTVATAEEAKRAEAAGADVIVAQGWEAGGHVWGEITTAVLVPAVVDAVSVPVVAAGGIGDGRGLAAVLALGADGAWIGTRFVASVESTHVYKERILAARETDAIYTRVFSAGWPAPHRVLRNAALAAGEERPPSEPHDESQLETAALYAGQSAALVNDVKPAAQIVRDLVDEAEAALRKASGAVDVALERPAE
jgi:nitronate monooxygenase